MGKTPGVGSESPTKIVSFGKGKGKSGEGGTNSRKMLSIRANSRKVERAATGYTSFPQGQNDRSRKGKASKEKVSNQGREARGMRSLRREKLRAVSGGKERREDNTV